MSRPASSKLIEIVPAAPAPSPHEALESLLARSRALPPGCDLEGFFEDELRELGRVVREAGLKARAQDQAAASRKADFSPSAVPQVPGADEARADGAAPNTLVGALPGYRAGREARQAETQAGLVEKNLKRLADLHDQQADPAAELARWPTPYPEPGRDLPARPVVPVEDAGPGLVYDEQRCPVDGR